MDEQRLNRELDEVLAKLKDIERRYLSETSVFIGDIKDIFAIHLAVLYGYDDMSGALDFISDMYRSDEE